MRHGERAVDLDEVAGARDEVGVSESVEAILLVENLGACPFAPSFGNPWLPSVMRDAVAGARWSRG